MKKKIKTLVFSALRLPVINPKFRCLILYYEPNYKKGVEGEVKSFLFYSSERENQDISKPCEEWENDLIVEACQKFRFLKSKEYDEINFMGVDDFSNHRHVLTHMYFKQIISKKIEEDEKFDLE